VTSQSARRPLLSGSVDQLSVPDLLQTVEAGRRSGVIMLRHPLRQGMLWLRDGRVVDAEIDGGSRGADAVYEMAFWDEGTFEVDFTAVAAPERIFQPTSALLLEAMRRRDEAMRDAPPPHAAIPDPPPQPPRPLLAVHRGLTLLNVASSYAADFLEPSLLARRLEEVRLELLAEHPALAELHVAAGGAISASPEASLVEAEATVAAVSLWLARFFARMENALPGRFPLRKLRQMTEALQEDLESLGFYRELGFDAGPPR
jgi:hypothetical protein